MSPAQFLQRVSAAAGTLLPGRYIYVERTTHGSTVSTQTYHTDGTNWVTLWKVGPFITSSGDYQGQRWDRTVNGTILLDSQLRDDPNALALARPDDPKNRVTLTGPNAQNQYVLELSPPGGYHEVRYYDATSLALVRDIVFVDGRKRTTDYGDYRRVYGRLRSFSERYSDGRTENSSTTTTLSFQRVDDDDTSLTIPIPQPLYSLPNDAAVKLATSITPDGLVLPAAINGHSVNFILDSGASDLTIDPATARQVGMQSVENWTQSTGSGDYNASLAEAHDLNVGPLSMHDVQFVTAPIHYVNSGTRIDGLLGCDFLAGSIVEINFKTGSVVLHPRTFDPTTVGARGFPMDVNGCLPRVNATFEGVEGSFLVDTGSFALILEPRYFNKLKAGLTDYGTGVLSVGGGTSTQEYTVGDLIFGGIDFKRNVVVVPQTALFDSPAYDGFFGRNLLRYYVMYLDYFDRMVYLKPNL